jgi:hypothetical protein
MISFPRSINSICKRLSNKAILKVFMRSIPRHAKIPNSKLRQRNYLNRWRMLLLTTKEATRTSLI